jgi:3-oxoacyl-[acyl-carrier-protein] synthase-3
MPVWISRVGHHVPGRVVDNESIIRASSLKMRASWVEKFIGIRERRWVEGESTSDLGARAVESLGRDCLDAFDGALFLATVSPDHLTPSTAIAMKKKLGLGGRRPAIDVNAACAGHLFALELAIGRLETTEEREALVVSAEIRSRFLDPLDRRTVFLFGDGAAAMLVSRDPDPPGRIEWVETGSAPSDEMEILVPAGGAVRPLSEEVLRERAQYIRMNDGPKIVEQTTQLLVSEIRACLAARRTSVDDYDFFVFHQGSGAISRKICESLGVAPDKTWSNFDVFGNTSSASLGIALSDAHGRGLVRKGDRVLLVAMGAGYHFGMASVVWGL